MSDLLIFLLLMYAGLRVEVFLLLHCPTRSSSRLLFSGLSQPPLLDLLAFLQAIDAEHAFLWALFTTGEASFANPPTFKTTIIPPLEPHHCRGW